MKKSVPHVALLVETSNAYCRTLIEGVGAYVREHSPWSIYLEEHERGTPVPAWIQGWDGDGIIIRAENMEMAEAVRQTGVPVVNVSSTHTGAHLPTVMTDEEAMARLAIDHLMERGFRQYAFCGVSGHSWSKTRENIFATIVHESGCPFHVYTPHSKKKPKVRWENEHVHVAEWVESLPMPIGIIAPYDFRGQLVLDACRRSGVAVPEQVAVISLGNDKVVCELPSPPLSSVITNAYRVGMESAAMLDRLMDGKTIVNQTVLIQPLGVHTRRSTEILAIDDPEIASALRYIHENACDGLTVGDLISNLSKSRRAFDYRFKKLVGRSPKAEILRAQLERVKQLLIHTKLPIGTIADKAGFNHASYMSDVFMKMTGMRPGAYRAERQEKPPDQAL